MPFDQFTVEQLAGDLLNNPTQNQRIATGFLRNHTMNQETGIIDEEYRVEYVVDRLTTMATTWMGLTVNCARCHDHKFDPLSQKEFYQLFAFFNNGPIRGLAGSKGNEKPLLEVATASQRDTLNQLQQASANVQRKLKEIEPQLAAAQKAWKATAIQSLPLPSSHGLIAHYEFEEKGKDSSKLNHPAREQGKLEYPAGLLGTAAELNGDALFQADQPFDFEHTDPFSFSVWINLTSGLPACVLSKTDETKSLRGFDLMIRKGKAVVHLIHKWNDNAIQVTTREPISRNRWQHIMVTYDGSSSAAGVRVYLDGKPVELDIKYDTLSASIRNKEPFRIGRRGTSAPFIGLIDDVRVYNRALNNDEVRQLAVSQFLQGALANPANQNNSSLKSRLREYFIEQHADGKIRSLVQKSRSLQSRISAFAGTIPTTMVMQDLKQPRDTFLLNRGQYDQPGEKVTNGVPASLPPLPANAPDNRLGLARWLVNPSHPLTARVAVNRLWQQLFGTGIVKTVEDFGSQGEWPSHPRLLDWLATEFIHSGWDVKHIQRLIVNSATYRQSSRVPGDLLKRDPENRLLARGPRYRMEAEMLRDNALAISGLLAERLGGPSVKPYQPRGLWKAVVYDGNLEYQQDHGAALYRRGVYTFWKRQSPPPALLAFDAPTRETCTARRARTNTPLQALALMNDPNFIEASRVLAERMLVEPKKNNPKQRIHFAFRLATARKPSQQETGILLNVYRAQLNEFQQNKKAAKELLSVGESKCNSALDSIELAAWTSVASMILSLDEAITKN